MPELYRRGGASDQCCWFDDYEQAVNWDGNNSNLIAILAVSKEELMRDFSTYGCAGMRMVSGTYSRFENRILEMDIYDFLEIEDELGA